MIVPPLVRHQLMMAMPRLWPCHPFLPLVRQRDDGGLDLGILVDAGWTPAFPFPQTTVVRANLLLLPESEDAFLALEREVFPTLAAVLDAGWRVD